MPRKNFLSWSIFILLCVIWGSSFIMMKYSTLELTPLQVAAVRIFAAAIVFLPFSFFHLRSIPRKLVWLAVLTGFLGNLFPAILFATAIANGIDSSLAGILNALTPLFVIFTGVLFFGSRFARSSILGVVIGFIGLALLFILKGMKLENLQYAGLVLLATISYGINVNIVSRHLGGIPPVKLATFSIGLLAFPSALMLWYFDVFQLPMYDEPVFLAVAMAALLGVAGSALASALFYVLVKRAGGLFSSLVTYGIPFIAVIWGLIYGEIITIPQVGCLGIILVGVYLANRRRE